MKGCKAIQIILGIVCALMTIALGTVAVLLFLPYLGGELTGGVFHSMFEGVSTIASTVGLAGLEWVVICVVFALPTLLLFLSTNLLLYGRRGGSIVAGSLLALVALVIAGGVTGWFSKELFAHWQKLYLIVLGGGSFVFLILFLITLSAVKRAKKKAVATAEPTAQQGDVEEIIITVEVDGDVDGDTTVDVVDTAVTETDEPAEEEGDILYMAQDYSSVSEVADETYDHNDVLPKKVLEKLKIARELYEKGALTKEEYLAIVNKYLMQE